MGRKRASDEVAARLLLALVRATRYLRQEAAADLSPALISALSTIRAHGPISPSELAARERLARPGATRVIARLSEGGLVYREEDLSDGRVYRVAITPEGAELLERARERTTALLSEAVQSLEARERALLGEAADLLMRLVEDEL
jgi:DNA-binding MarR family transcriptional regulator